MTQVVKSLEAKVEELKSLESTAIEQQAKVTQMEAKVTQLEAQLELNVSPILFNLIQSFTVGKHFCFSMTE
jgi:multidrug resistance efflux pump